jgi:ribosome maturation factor RimP
MSTTRQNVELERLLQPGLGALGYELLGCEVHQQRNRTLLRVYIDQEQGITLDDCEKASRQIGAVPELESLFSGPYTLEVSSPGLDRPLFKIEHFQRFIGEKVQLRTHSPIEGQRNFSGVIVSALDKTIVLKISHLKQVELQFEQIEKAKLVPAFDF